jgi:hypothetical protein
VAFLDSGGGQDCNRCKEEAAFSLPKSTIPLSCGFDRFGGIPVCRGPRKARPSGYIHLVGMRFIPWLCGTSCSVYVLLVLLHATHTAAPIRLRLCCGWIVGVYPRGQGPAVSCIVPCGSVAQVPALSQHLVALCDAAPFVCVDNSINNNSAPFCGVQQAQ